MFCTNCGSKLVDGAKFCSECGARVVRPEEPVFRTNPEIQFEEPKVAAPVVEAPVYDETPERPVREKVSFDWSNVVDEPHRRDVSDIKSPWATTGGIDEKEIYAEMTPPTGKSRTMSFIDILKAEKEEKEKAAAEKAIEYTEVLHFDPDLTAFDEAPQLHYAPLYDDVDEPVTTPFDIPEEEKAEPVFEEPAFEEEPLFEEPKFDDFAEEPVVEEPAFEEPVIEEPVFDEPQYEEPQRMSEAAKEPELEVSRETIAQFDEYVKSFEKEAGIISEPEFEEPVFEEPVIEEPVIEEPVVEEPVYEGPKFELPDFLKKVTGFAAEKEEEPVAEEPAEEEPEFEEPEEEPAAEEFEPEEVEFEEPEFEPEFEPEVTPDIDELFAGLTPASQAAEEEPEVEESAEEEPEFEEPAEEEPVAEEFEPEEIELEEPVVEEPAEEEPAAEEAFEEPKYDEGEYEEPSEAIESLEDLYLDFESAAPSGRTTRFDISAYDDIDDDDDEEEEKEEEEEGINEDELFREMEETKSEVPGMTIAPPADKQEEIEALRKRLAELTGIDLYQVADLNAAMSLDELEEAEEAEEAVAETPEEDNGDELFDEPSDDLFEVEVTPDIDELFAGLTPASVSDEPVIEEVFEEESVIEEPVAEEPVFEEPEVEDFVFEPEVTPDIDELFAELTPASVPDEPVIEEEPVVADFAPVEEVVEEVAEEAEPVVEEAVEEVVEDIYLQDFEPFERAPREFREEPEEIFEEAVEEDAEEAEPVVEEFAPVEEEGEPVAEEVIEEAEEEVEPVAEEAVEEPVVADFAPVEEVVEEVVEEPAPAVEEAPAVKETDALSLEELERDLFGETPAEEVEAEETKKIDKFYTLYRKNEEFQRLLDEEYEKLRHGGGLTEEEKAAVDAVPKMADVEAAKAAAAAGAVGAVGAVAAAAAAPAPEAVPVENKKAYRQVEDETIYMSKEELDAKLKAEAAAIAAANAPAEVPEDKAAKKKQEKKAKKKVEVEYEDVESGSKFLTVLAVIIALILIVLLAVILILQIAPDSGIAAWINSLIESITSRFGLVEPYMDQFLL